MPISGKCFEKFVISSLNSVVLAHHNYRPSLQHNSALKGGGEIILVQAYYAPPPFRHHCYRPTSCTDITGDGPASSSAYQRRPTGGSTQIYKQTIPDNRHVVSIDPP